MFNVLEKLKYFYFRITLSPLHIAYFLLAFIYCWSIVFLQALSFANNGESRDFMLHLMNTANVSTNVLAVLTPGANGPLMLCSRVPGSGMSAGMGQDLRDVHRNCAQAFPVLTPSPPAKRKALVEGEVEHSFVQRRKRGHTLSRKAFSEEITLQPTFDTSKQLLGMYLFGLDSNSNSGDRQGQSDAVWISTQCTSVLRYPEQMFQDATRQSIAVIFLQFWLLLVSLVSVIGDSIPHLGAGLIYYCLSAINASWNLYSTFYFQSEFKRVVATGSCDGVNLVPGYFKLRLAYDGATAAISIVAFFLGIYLSVKLTQRFLQATYKGAGASFAVNKMYKVLVTFATFVRLTLFWAILSNALWIDQLRSGVMVTFLSRDAYIGNLVGSCIILVCVVPWLILSEYSIPHERRRWTLAFFALTLFIFAQQIFLFVSSPVYRWTLILWPFFASASISAVVLMGISLIFAVWCRVNFGKGLGHYLQVLDTLESSGFPGAYMPTNPSKEPDFHCRGESENALEDLEREVKDRKISDRSSIQTFDVKLFPHNQNTNNSNYNGGKGGAMGMGMPMPGYGYGNGYGDADEKGSMDSEFKERVDYKENVDFRDYKPDLKQPQPSPPQPQPSPPQHPSKARVLNSYLDLQRGGGVGIMGTSPGWAKTRFYQ